MFKKVSINDQRVKRVLGLDITFSKLVCIIQHERQLHYEKARREGHLLLCEMEQMSNDEKKGAWRFRPLVGENLLHRSLLHVGV